MYAKSSSADLSSARSRMPQCERLRNVAGGFVEDYDDEIYWLIFLFLLCIILIFIRVCC